MDSAEKKARELISQYGPDMAVSQARYYAGRAGGVMRRWWRRVLEAVVQSAIPSPTH